MLKFLFLTLVAFAVASSTGDAPPDGPDRPDRPGSSTGDARPDRPDNKPGKPAAGKPKGPKGAFCDKDEIDACGAKPADCGDDEMPSRDGCCISCKKPKADTCTPPEGGCDKALESSAVCDRNNMTMVGGKPAVKDMYDFATCCLKCKRPQPPKKATCTKDDIKKCIDDEFTLECQEGEKAETDNNCCRTCKRSNPKRSMKDIGECGTIAVCAADEAPSKTTAADGEASCPTCKPAKPTCATACSATQVCVRKMAADTAKCVGKKAHKFKVKAIEAGAKSFVNNCTSDEVRAMLVEMVERFCDNADNAEKCDAHRQALVDGIMVRITKEGDDETEVEVDVPEAAARRRSLLAESSPSSLLSESVADSVDNELSMESVADDSAPEDGPVQSSAFRASLSTLVLVGVASVLVM